MESSKPLRKTSFPTAGAKAPADNQVPAIAKTGDKAGAKPVLIGSGEHTYEWIDRWAKLPAGMSFGNTHAVQETADGRIVIHQGLSRSPLKMENGTNKQHSTRRSGRCQPRVPAP